MEYAPPPKRLLLHTLRLILPQLIMYLALLFTAAMSFLMNPRPLRPVGHESLTLPPPLLA